MMIVYLSLKWFFISASHRDAVLIRDLVRDLRAATNVSFQFENNSGLFWVFFFGPNYFFYYSLFAVFWCNSARWSRSVRGGYFFPDLRSN